MFAPRFHPTMTVVAQVCKPLKIKTAFNILGPMFNPSHTPHSIVGVYHENLISLTIAFNLFNLEIVAIIQMYLISLLDYGSTFSFSCCTFFCLELECAIHLK